jgi:hypothetical protein
MRGRERWLAVAAVAMIAGCGGGSSRQTASNGPDGGASDAAGTPMPPKLGAQLDRMGRPGVGEFLIATLGGTDAADRQAAYRQADDPKTWLTTPLATNVTIESEIRANIGPFDAIDAGAIINSVALPGCTNTLGYTTPASFNSYDRLVDVLADDELYLDTGKPTCTTYFELELELMAGGTLFHTACGGRTLDEDAPDVLISVLVAGFAGLDRSTGYVPFFHSAATVHADITDTFPFLGPPNP